MYPAAAQPRALNLEVVAQHVIAEVAEDIPALMATLQPDPEYLFVSDVESACVEAPTRSGCCMTRFRE